MIILLTKSAPAHIEGLIAVVFGVFFLLWLASITTRWLKRKPWKRHPAVSLDVQVHDGQDSSSDGSVDDKDLPLTSPGRV